MSAFHISTDRNSGYNFIYGIGRYLVNKHTGKFIESMLIPELKNLTVEKISE